MFGVALEAVFGVFTFASATIREARFKAAIEPIRLTTNDMKEITDECRASGKSHPLVEMQTMSMTDADFVLALQIRAALTDAGFNVGIPEATGRIRNGVNVSGPSEHWDAVLAIEDALLKHGIQLIGATGLSPAGSPIHIWVGPRIMGKLP